MLTYELKKSPGVPLYEALYRCIRQDILSGGLILGAVFMATDYTTSPMNRSAQYAYSVGIGFLTMIIRPRFEQAQMIHIPIVFPLNVKGIKQIRKVFHSLHRSDAHIHRSSHGKIRRIALDDLRSNGGGGRHGSGSNSPHVQIIQNGRFF